MFIEIIIFFIHTCTVQFDTVIKATKHVDIDMSANIFFQELKNQRDRLKQLQKKITLQIEKERETARQLLKDGKKE